MDPIFAESVDREKMGEAVSTDGVDYGKAVEAVDKQKAADSVDTDKAREALMKQAGSAHACAADTARVRGGPDAVVFVVVVDRLHVAVPVLQRLQVMPVPLQRVERGR